MRVLAADIGGTHTRLALYDDEGGDVRDAEVPSADHPDFESIAKAFLGEGRVDAVGIGVAGPVRDGVAKTTNLPWRLSETELSQALGASKVVLINDFDAIALGIPVLQAAELIELQHGVVDEGARLIVGAGTGLGVAVIASGGAVPSEAGHIGFAPHDENEADLWRFARAEVGNRVTVEHLISGPGLARLYRYYSSLANHPPQELEGAGVAAAAADGDETAQRALDHFVGLYGGLAGDLALTVLPRAGVFVAGGIAPKVHAQLGERFAELFMARFVDKHPMTAFVDDISVRLVNNSRCGLLGAREAALGATL